VSEIVAVSSSRGDPRSSEPAPGNVGGMGRLPPRV